MLAPQPIDGRWPYAWPGRTEFVLDDEWVLTLDSRHEAVTWFSATHRYGG